MSRRTSRGCCVRLLLDTSGGEAICALADGEGVILEQRALTGTEASRQFGELAGQVLGGLLAYELDCVVAGLGPGSFIGTRVGISYANGLAAAGGVPLYAVNSLAAIAAVYGSAQAAVARDARRGEVFLYDPRAAGAECAMLPVDGLEAELARRGVRRLVLDDGPQAGRGWTETRDSLLALAGRLGIEAQCCPGVPAEGLRRLALPVARVAYAEPVYLRGFL
jgi:tRNA threonylcarbamoyl adenosine modification protein YeaZ